jgi:glycosyltransferase involved in cell wall biosynthesis
MKSSGSPKLLFLAHTFPPLRSSGCVRNWNIAKYLARMGWDVSVVTPHPRVWRFADNGDTYARSLEKEGIRLILTDHHWQFLFPETFSCSQHLGTRLLGALFRRLAGSYYVDRGLGWSKPVESSCGRLNKDDVDVILTSGYPFSSFRLAARIGKRLGKPYVLDYRDPWTGNPHMVIPKSVARQEAELLDGSAAVTVVSPSWSSAMERRFHLGSKLHVVTNGYDPEDFSSVVPMRFGHFAMVYAGIFYPPRRVISPIFAALRLLKGIKSDSLSKCVLHYFGPHSSHVEAEARRYDVSPQLVIHGNVSRQQVLSALRGAGLGIVITTVAEEVSAKEAGIIPAKVFEALGAGTPILIIAPPGTDIRPIAESTGLARCFSGSDSEGIAAFIQERMSGERLKRCDGSKYSWSNLALQFDSILRNVAH